VLAVVTALAAVAPLTAGCDRKSSPSAAREEQVEFVETRQLPRQQMAPFAPPPPAPAMPAADVAASAVADEADFAGQGVAGAASARPPGFKTLGAAQAGAVARAGAPAQGGVAAEAAAMLIRTGTAAVEVDSLETAVARVRALAERVGGYVANSSLAAGREQLRSATLELRVPAARFDELVGGLAPFGRVERVEVQAQDVGEEFVDVTARVANARRLEARLVELLATRTGRLHDVLSVERELARVREEVERHEGRLRYLRTRSATSTLTVTVHERPPLLAATPNATPVADAFRAAGRNFVALLTAVIAASGVWAPVGVVVYALLWRWRRRRALGAVTRRGAGSGAPPAAPPPAPSAA
jgi:hypothetical protein